MESQSTVPRYTCVEKRISKQQKNINFKMEVALHLEHLSHYLRQIPSLCEVLIPVQTWMTQSFLQIWSSCCARQGNNQWLKPVWPGFPILASNHEHRISPREGPHTVSFPTHLSETCTCKEAISWEFGKCIFRKIEKAKWAGNLM
jgi:hypothetical protein